MPTREELKAAACEAIDRRSDDLIAVAKDILNNPEPATVSTGPRGWWPSSSPNLASSSGRDWR